MDFFLRGMIAALILHVLAHAGFVHADAGRPLTVRGNSPFTHIFGLPGQPTGAIEATAGWESTFALQVVNHADMADEGDESVVLDGETYFANWALRRGLSARLEIGVDVPYVSHRSGSLDGFIKNWHDLWGISNTNREGPEDELLIRYMRAGMTPIQLLDSTSGIGDVRLWANYALRESSEGSGLWSRVTVKLPTGDEDELHGSGAADISFDVSTTRRVFSGSTTVDLAGYLGLLVLGDGDVLSDLQEDVVPFGGASIVWGINRSFELVAQVSAQGSYFDSTLDEIGGTTAQISAGGRFLWPDANADLAIAIVEDLVSDVSPDVAFHVEFRKGF